MGQLKQNFIHKLFKCYLFNQLIMAIDYDDLKSGYVECPANSKVEFEIVKDPIKTQRMNNKNPDKPKIYFQYEFWVRVNGVGDALKYSVFKSQLREMTNELGRPESLVGTKWRLTHTFVDDRHEWSLVSIKSFTAKPVVGLG